MTYKKLISILGIILVATIIVARFSAINGQSSDKIIKIGVVLPLTGSQAFAGESMKNSLIIAQKDLEDKQNLGKAVKYQYKLIFEDDAFDAKTAANAAQKLISVDKVDAIIDAYAPIGNVISPIAENNKIVHIGVAFDPKIAVGEYNFLLFTTPDTAAKTFLAELQKKGIHRLGIIKVNNQGILSVDSALAKYAHDYNIEIVSNEMFQPGQRDFRDLIVKSSKTNAEIYALLALSPEIEVLSKQMSDLGLHNQTTVIYFEVVPNKSVFEGLWSVGYGKISDDWNNEYRKTYGSDPGFGAANVYDAFNVIVAASESSDDASRKPKTEYIANQIQGMSEFDGVLGILHINSDGIIDTPASIKVIKNGKMVVVE